MATASTSIASRSDAERVSQVLGAYRAHGLATVGVAGVKAALERGQVDRLLVPAIPAASAADQKSSGVDSSGTKEQRGRDLYRRSATAEGSEGRRRYVAVPRVAVAVLACACFDGVCRCRKPMSA
jgi:hypothetical protein